MNARSLFFYRSLGLAVNLFVCDFAAADTVINFGSVTQITSADDLDLAGDMVYAINFSAGDPEMTVNGVLFTPDTAPPADATFVGPKEVTAWQTRPEFGDSPDNDALEEIFADIRWADHTAGEVLEAHLPVLAGQPYKLQLLFYGNHPEDRKWDIEIEDALFVDAVTSLGATVGDLPPDYSPNAGVVYTTTLTAGDDMLDVRFVGDSNDLASDRNPIWQAMTVEKLPALADTDADGLSDAWETTNFGNLAQTPAGDPDGDGLPNLGEFQTGADPKDVDSDDDGLNDGPEVNTHTTSPTRADTDGDGLGDGAELNTHFTNPKDPDFDHDTLTDGAEVNTLLTNPKNIDTDNDGFNDPTEVLNGTDPAQAASKPGVSHIVRVLGGDSQAEGLDLDGTFLYAFNVGTPGAAGQVRDADFTDDLQPGISWVAENEIPVWQQVNFGDTRNDTNLEFVFQSVRWAQAPNTLTVSLDGLTMGSQYKLQLLFGEQCCAGRGFDLNVEGETVIDDFNTAFAQLLPNHPYAGGAIVHSFAATDTTLDIELNGTTTTFGDMNPILSGVTLEAVGAPSSTFLITSVVRTPVAGGVTVALNFSGRAGKSYAVDYSTDLASWTEINDSALAGGGGTGAYTDPAPARTNATHGYYRLRDPVLQPSP